jgi:hypothetical protein
MFQEGIFTDSMIFFSRQSGQIPIVINHSLGCLFLRQTELKPVICYVYTRLHLLSCSKRSGFILGSAGVFGYVTMPRSDACSCEIGDVYTHLPINLRFPAS